MSPEFLQKWERLIDGIDKQTIPIEFIKKLILKLEGKRQRTINVEKLLKQGLEADQIEDAVSRILMELDDQVISIEFVLNVQSIAETVQPETDRLLNKL
jgi:hypothetical protein